MCSVGLVQIRLDGRPYEYAREYVDEKTVLHQKPTTTSPWDAMQSLYIFPHLDNKENRTPPSTVASAPLCVEIVAIFNVRAQDDTKKVETVWKLSKGSFYDPALQAQTLFHKEELMNKHAWLFNSYAVLTADDALELRTIAPYQAPPQVFRAMHHALRRV
jgi:hypothetical protein